MSEWQEKPPEFVARRYDRLAPFYGVFEWLYALPIWGVRRKTVDALDLRPGDHVLELGVGSGKNLARLRDRVGETGRVFGVDISSGMLDRAGELCKRKAWSNVDLTLADVGSHALPGDLDAALFCFSYSTMRDRQEILRDAWDHLKPGGRLVITDATLREGRAAKLATPTSNWVSKRTLVGNPNAKPWRDLEAIAGDVQKQTMSFAYVALFVICVAVKSPASGSAEVERLAE